MNLKDIKQNKENECLYDDYLKELLSERNYTKQELMDLFHTSDRQIRLNIQVLSLFKPVISLSCQKGYHLVNTREIVESGNKDKIQAAMLELKMQLKEDNARIKMLKKRMKPLIASLKVLEKC